MQFGFWENEERGEIERWVAKSENGKLQAVMANEQQQTMKDHEGQFGF